MRYLASFSCGIPSAVAAKMTVEKYKDKAVVYYCDTFSQEHPDNVRFFMDVQKWIGVEIKIIRSKEYTDVKDVWEKTGWLIGPKGARCTTEMKKIPRMDFQEPGDVHILGFTYEKREQNRMKNFRKNNPELQTESILIDAKMKREDCFKVIEKAGIEEPAMYKLGYKNNNCIGCVKGAMGYWNKIRKDFPEVFKEMAERERKMNVAICHTTGSKIDPKTGKPERIKVFLDELAPNRGNYKTEAGIECGIYCQAGK